MKLGFDLDGCVVNFIEQYIRLYYDKYHKVKTLDDIKEYYSIFNWCKSKEDHQELVRRTIIWWNSLYPYDGAIEFLTKYGQNNTLIFITSRTKNVIDETKIWLSKYLQNTPFVIKCVNNSNEFGTNTKSELCKKYDITHFIEDHIETAEDLVNNDIEVFMPNRPWNRGVNNPKIKYLGNSDFWYNLDGVIYE